MTNNEKEALEKIAAMPFSDHGPGEPCPAEEMYKIIDEAAKREPGPSIILMRVLPGGDDGRSCCGPEMVGNARRLLKKYKESGNLNLLK